MTDVTTIPSIDGYETTLSQSWDGSTGLMYVNAVPNITLEAGQTFYVTVRAGNTEQQVAEIDAIDAGAKTLNVSNVTIEKGTGTAYGTYTHPVGSSVIISDNYEVWKDIKTAINSKADTTELDALLGNYQFTGDDFENTAGNWKITKSGNSMVFSDGETAPVTLKTLATGAPADQYVAISENDTTVGHLYDKFNAGNGLIETIGTPGGNETLDVAVDTTDTTTFVKTSSGATDEDKVPVLDATGKLADGFIPTLTPTEKLSNLVWVSPSEPMTELLYASDDTQEQNLTAAWVELKSITVKFSGSLFCFVEGNPTSGGTAGQIRILINGAVKDTLNLGFSGSGRKELSNIYEVSSDDEITIETYVAQCRNFRIYTQGVFDPGLLTPAVVA